MPLCRQQPAGSCDRIRQPGLGKTAQARQSNGPSAGVYPGQSFRQQDQEYSRPTVVALPRPTDDSRAISQAAHTGLASNYQPGYRYAKAGVMLLARNDASVDQGELALEETIALLRETGGPRLMHQRWRP